MMMISRKDEADEAAEAETAVELPTDHQFWIDVVEFWAA